MRRLIPLRSWRAALLTLLLALAVAAFAAPQFAQTPAALPAEVADARPLASSAPVASSAPTIVPPSPTAAPTAEPTATTEPTAAPTTTPPAPLRVGLQVGHWHSDELPEELARLRGNTGAAAGGYTETEVNLAIGKRVAALLREQGLVVDLLPATVPPAYKADAFVAIHADGSTSAATSGFKIATPWRTSAASQHLLDALVLEYGDATALPQDAGITFNMRGYYAFSRRFRHAIDRTTPAVILEMGFLTNASDRALMTGQPDRVAGGIARGITRYLAERDPNDLAALQPPNFSMQRVVAPEGADIHAAPKTDAPVLLHVAPGQSLMPFSSSNGWYQVVVRGGSRVVGWVDQDAVSTAPEPPPTN